MRYGLVPWTGSGRLGAVHDPFRPAGVDLAMPGAGWIDLRGDASQQAGWAIVNVPVGPFPAGGIELAGAKDETPSSARRNLLQNRLGLTLERAQSFDRTVLELLSRHSTPAGDHTRWNPIQPMHDRMYRVFLGGLLIEVPSISGGSVVFTDDFNRADSTTLGGNWVEEGGVDLKIVSNKLVTNSLAADVRGWNTSGVGSADYEVEVVSDGQTATDWGLGPIGRVAVSAGSPTDFYFAYMHYTVGGGGFVLYKFVASSYSLIGSVYTYGTGAGAHTTKLSMNGSAIKGYLDGVERDSVTDTSLSAEGYFGVRLFDSAGDDSFDDFVVYDFAGGTARPRSLSMTGCGS